MTPEHEITYRTLQAQWWIASATTGHCLSSQLYHGTGKNRPFTDAEKIAHALETAQRHIAMIAEISDNRQTFNDEMIPIIDKFIQDMKLYTHR